MRAILCVAIKGEFVYQNLQVASPLKYLNHEDKVDYWIFQLTMMQREMVKAGCPIESHRWGAIELPCLT